MAELGPAQPRLVFVKLISYHSKPALTHRFFLLKLAFALTPFTSISTFISSPFIVLVTTVVTPLLQMSLLFDGLILTLAYLSVDVHTKAFVSAKKVKVL